MSNNRKLQAEISQVIKKIEEGMNEFDEIWEKVYSADTQAHKERWEAELKKEIKKLQRFRDQIKGWISSPDVKDKTPLTEARKNVESKMEQFKVCERETKTKAYSREGLAREAKVDPKEAEKEGHRTWLNEHIQALNDINESLEADVEKLCSTKKGSKNKDSIEKMQVKIKKNKWHIVKLEQIKRLVENDEVESEMIDDIKDEVDYYVESAPDDDGSISFEEMLEFTPYEPLNLDINPIAQSVSSAITSSALDDDDDAGGKTKSKKVSKAQAKALLSTPKQPEVGTKTSIAASLGASSKIGKAVTPVVAAVKTVVTPVEPAVAATPSVWATPAAGVIKSSADATAAPKPTVAAIVAGTSGHPPQSTATSAPPATLPVRASSAPESAVGPSTSEIQRSVTSTPKTGSAIPGGLASGVSPTINSSVSTGGAPSNAYCPPRPAPAPLAPELLSSLNMLNCSMACMSSERSAGKSNATAPAYTPRQPHVGHPSFPTVQPPRGIIENPKLFERLSYDTLFLAFYYQQGSYQQNLTAKQLKKHSWRYHRKYMTWFQRHEEPKTTTDEYEEGTYVYFDYENGWTQRIKPDFKFEYAHLEDELGV